MLSATLDRIRDVSGNQPEDQSANNDARRYFEEKHGRFSYRRAIWA